MVFNSYEYLIFLAVVVGLHAAQPNARRQNALLLAASLLFYARWDWRFPAVIVVMALVNYGAGRWINSLSDRQRKWMFAGAVAANLFALGVFKYLNFFLDSAVSLLKAAGVMVAAPALQIIIPAGIAFYTLQQLTYLIGVYRRELHPTRDLLQFAAFTVFFPQLLAGPIERAARLLPQWEQRRRPTPDQVESGLLLILSGLFKKMVLADVAASLIDPRVFSDPGIFSGGEVLLTVYLFAAQVYLDFAAYSDIARGSARLLGIELMVNFRQPYFAQTISEFWSRWHISLSSWFRDYVFLPVSRGLLKRWGSARAPLVLVISHLVTMLISGLWHGANWTFVTWGLLLGVYMVISHQLRGRALPYLRHRSPIVRYLTTGLRLALTFHLILSAWVFFRIDAISLAPAAFERLASVLLKGDLGKGAALIAPTLALYAAMLALDLAQAHVSEGAFRQRLPGLARTAVYAGALLVIAFFSVKPYVPFVYFQF